MLQRWRVTLPTQSADEKLREADARKDIFLATLAHELRNPLAVYQQLLQLIKLADGDRRLTAEAREMAERQLEHMVVAY